MFGKKFKKLLDFKLFMKDKLQRLNGTVIAYIHWGMLSVKSKIGIVKEDRNPDDKKKLLLLVGAFPPISAPGVYRPLSFVKYGVGFGWKISVISGPTPEIRSEAGEYLAKRVPIEVDVFRLNCKIVPSYKLFPRVDGGFINALDTVSIGQAKLRDDPPDVVMASGPPFYSFIAAYYLSRLFKAKLVLDYRDEWTECPFDFVQRGRWDLKWENLCLKQADLVFFTTKPILEHYLKTFRSLRIETCRVIPNGWEPMDFLDGGMLEVASRSEEDGKCVISFIGTLGDHSSPEKFLKTLEIVLEKRRDLLEALRIRFVGAKYNNAEKQLHDFKFREILDIKDQVPKNVANYLMKKASALLLFCDQRFIRAIPGKFYDYLKAGPPIIVVGEKGEAVNILKTLKAGFVLKENDPDALEKILETLIKGNSNCNRTAIEEWLELHTRKNISERVFETLNQLIV
jgi:glycosyltransferase involved in cell wall biosynthesis